MCMCVCILCIYVIHKCYTNMLMKIQDTTFQFVKYILCIYIYVYVLQMEIVLYFC